MSFRKEGNIFFKEKTILVISDPKQLLTVDFVCVSYLKKYFQSNVILNIPDIFWAKSLSCLKN